MAREIKVLHCGRERPAGDLREGGGGQADDADRRGGHRGRCHEAGGDQPQRVLQVQGCGAAVQRYEGGAHHHLYCMLKDNTGVLSSVLSVFATSGANILTINQSIPTNGCAAVTISAETSGLAETLEKLMADVAAVDGVVRVEVLAG